MYSIFLEFAKSFGISFSIIILILFSCKSLIEKWFENKFEDETNKSLSKFQDVLSRRTQAYQILLNKEFNFYELISKNTSDLSITIQDYYHELDILFKDNEYTDLENIKKHIVKYCEIIISTKNILQINFCFITKEIMNSTTDLIVYMQNNADNLYLYLNKYCEKKLNEEELNNARIIVDELILLISTVMALITKRLEKLSIE